MKDLKWEDAAYHQYCQQCGCNVIPLQQFVCSHDAQTGKEILHTIYVCVNWKWWKPYHFREEFDEKNKLVSTCDY